MRCRHFKKRYFILGAISFVFLCYVSGFLYTHIYIHESITRIVCDFGDIREAFFQFRDEHGRWPNAMNEIYGTKISDGTVVADYQDSFSDEPFRCVTGRKYFYSKKSSNEKPYKVLVTMSRPYRTELWPFGETKTIILISDGGVVTVSPSDIVGNNGQTR